MGNNKLKDEILNLSNSKLKKLNKLKDPHTIRELILDDNELQRLDNIDLFIKLEKLSARRNQLLRMYGVCRLTQLHTLDFSHNGILMIEGLKDLTGLKYLNLSGNSIKTIEHLSGNVNLERLDLSENSISHITDLSCLKNLKELYLHKNKINHLGQCDRFLPASLVTLTLAYNNITDLNEISRLSHLSSLTKISIANNPCVNMTGNNVGFDYRPFVINWCLNVNVIDDYVVDAIESLRAEWLYSQGRGRHFRIGDQKELIEYLAMVCPLTGEALETEDDRKLRLILSKAQHHQQQLREQSSSSSPHPSPAFSRKKSLSPRTNSLRTGNQTKSPDRMAISCYQTTDGAGDTFSNETSVMTQSLDASMLNFYATEKPSELVNHPLHAVTKMVPVPENLMSPDSRPSPLMEKSFKNSLQISNSAKTRSPKPSRAWSNHTESQIRPNRQENATPSPHKQRRVHNSNIRQASSSILQNTKPVSDDEPEFCGSNLESIQMKADERRMQKFSHQNAECSDTEGNKVAKAAVLIQRIWRGYYTRNKDKDIQEMFRVLQNQRANQYIQKLTEDIETTKADLVTTKTALESERKIQILQTEAISALWKKISTLQTTKTSESGSEVNLGQNDPELVKELARTCNGLQNEIKQLQSSMQEMVKLMTAFGRNCRQAEEQGVATQTEIVAVHTPKGDEAVKDFPFQKQHRPSSLPLPQKKNELQATSEKRDGTED
ncbi:centrosomal protein of 97 kDa [Anthonomus grandis grandis]|uniref:centrosomal protein of 97 kDa n=1 Tax=Anthonomus grandis grandis TaxID=2921223 RepID=UPI0021656792|nr:centrosomal protein of 97 kDa [Anthonomus grandis grandis]